MKIYNSLEKLFYIYYFKDLLPMKLFSLNTFFVEKLLDC